MKIYLQIICLLLSCIQLLGQDNWAKIYSHPYSDSSDTIECKIKIAPLNFMFDVSSSYKIKEITDEGDTSRILNWSKVLGATKKKNGAFGQYAIQILNTEIAVKDWVFSGGFGARSEAYAAMDGPGIKLIVGGNTNLLDATTEIAPNVHYNSWYQIQVGAKKHLENSVLGGSLKLVAGVEHFYFKGGYDISTSDIFDEIRVDRLVRIQSTGLFKYQNLNQIEFRTSLPFTDGLNFDNPGLLIDLYASHRIGKHLFGLSISDIGTINWSEAGRTFEYEADGETSYSGIELADAFGNELEFNLQDSLENILGLQLTDTDSYNNGILTKLNIRYQYDHQEDLSFGINNFVALDGEYTYFRIGIFANKKLTPWWDVSIMNTMDNYSGVNLGVSTRISTKRIEIGLSSQNILALFDPYGYHLTNLNLTTQIKL